MPEYVRFIIFVLIILVVFLVLLYVMAKNIASGAFFTFTKRRDTTNSYIEDEKDPNSKMKIKTIDETLKCVEDYQKEVEIVSFDNLKFFGTLYSKKNDKIVIFFHDLGINPLKEAAFIIKMYLDNKIDVLVVTSRAHDKSEGKYQTYGILESFDVESWVQYVNGLGYQIYLQGVGLGATAILSASAQKMSNVKGIIVESPHISTYNMLEKSIKKIRLIGRMVFFIFSRRFNKINANLKKRVPIVEVEKSEYKILYLLPKKDDIACNDVEALYNVTKNGKIVVFVDASHGECFFKDEALYKEEVLDFIAK